jgi:hypothetical protein
MAEDTWEYRRESLGVFFQSFGVERRVDELLNRLGGEGWELVTSHRFWITNRYRFVFKRQVSFRSASPA